MANTRLKVVFSPSISSNKSMARLRRGRSYWIHKGAGGKIEQTELSRQGDFFHTGGEVPSAWRIDGSDEREGDVASIEVPDRGLFITQGKHGFTVHDVTRKPVVVKAWVDERGLKFRHVLSHSGTKILGDVDDVVTREIVEIEPVAGKPDYKWLKQHGRSYLARSTQGNVWELKTREAPDEVEEVDETLLHFMHNTRVQVTYGHLDESAHNYIVQQVWTLPNPHADANPPLIINIPSPDNDMNKDITLMGGMIRLMAANNSEELVQAFDSMSVQERMVAHDVLRIMHNVASQGNFDAEIKATWYYMKKLRESFPSRPR